MSPRENEINTNYTIDDDNRYPDLSNKEKKELLNIHTLCHLSKIIFPVGIICSVIGLIITKENAKYVTLSNIICIIVLMISIGQPLFFELFIKKKLLGIIPLNKVITEKCSSVTDDGVGRMLIGKPVKFIFFLIISFLRIGEYQLITKELLDTYNIKRTRCFISVLVSIVLIAVITLCFNYPEYYMQKHGIGEYSEEISLYSNYNLIVETLKEAGYHQYSYNPPKRHGNRAGSEVRVYENESNLLLFVSMTIKGDIHKAYYEIYTDELTDDWYKKADERLIFLQETIFNTGITYLDGTKDSYVYLANYKSDFENKYSKATVKEHLRLKRTLDNGVPVSITVETSVPGYIISICVGE